MIQSMLLHKKLFNRYIFVLLYIITAIILSFIYASPYSTCKEDIIYDSNSLTSSAESPLNFFVHNMPLDKGIYTVSYNYSTNSMCFADIYSDVSDSDILSETVFLENHKTHIEHRLYVKKDTITSLNIRIFDEKNSLSLTEFKIKYNETSTLVCSFIISMLFFSLILLFVLFTYDFVKKFDASARIRSLLFIAVFFIICIPVFFYSSTYAHDNVYHFSRISGIAEGLKSGVFPVRLHQGTYYDHGYPSGIYYGDLLLYLPALLHLAGFPLFTVYKTYIVFVNILTLYSSYTCFSILTKDKNAGAFGSLMYSTSTWYIIDVYLRSAVGEFTAMSFLPFVVLGLGLILSDKPELKRGSFYLVLGFTGIIQSHHLTTLMIFVFSLFVCLCLIKRLFKQKRFLTLMLSALICFLINSNFTVPFLDYYINVKVSANKGGSIQRFGTTIAQWFTSNYDIMGFSGDIADGTAHDMPQTVGTALLIVLIISVIYAIISKTELKKKILFISFLSALSLFMTTHIFPYDKIQTMLPVLYTLTGKYIQYPFRYFTVSAVLLSLLSSIVFSDVFNNRKHRLMYIVPAAILITSCFKGTVLMNEVANNFALLMPLDNEGIHNYLGDLMYVKEGVDVYSDAYKSLSVRSNDRDIRIYDETRNGFEISVKIVNKSERKAKITFPLWYYPGYKFYSSSSHITMSTNKYNEITVKVPPYFDGNITVKFVEPWYWRAAEAVSLLSLIIFLLAHKISGKKHFDHSSDPYFPKSKSIIL